MAGSGVSSERTGGCVPEDTPTGGTVGDVGLIPEGRTEVGLRLCRAKIVGLCRMPDGVGWRSG